MITPAVFSPFKRTLFVCVFAATSISAFAHSAYVAVRATPYDRQMTRINHVLNSATPRWPNEIVNLPSISLCMIRLREMPYHYSRYWQTPLEVNATQASDCKGKAVALYAQLRQSGLHNLRIVVGKRHIFDAATHAWLEWQTAAGNFVLDPTFNETPVPSNQLDPVTYVPFYAFDGAHKYRAINSSLTEPMTLTAPASGGRPAHARVR